MKKLMLIALLAVGCAAVPKQFSKKLHRELPPTRVGEFVRVDCQEFPEAGAVGCTYVGWRDGELCASIVVGIEGHDYQVASSTCDVAGVYVLSPEWSKKPPEAPGAESPEHQYEDTL